MPDPDAVPPTLFSGPRAALGFERDQWWSATPVVVANMELERHQRATGSASGGKPVRNFLDRAFPNPKMQQ